MCGLVGVVTSNDVGVCLYDTLTVLQHRGQDAAGIMTSDHGKLNLRKDNGLVKDVFHARHMSRLTGQMGIGHVRYPTAGGTSPALARQPIACTERKSRRGQSCSACPAMWRVLVCTRCHLA